MSLFVVTPIEGTLPVDNEAATRYLNERIMELNVAVLDLINSFFFVTHVEPSKPRDGMIRHADGTDWDPGDGEGLYVRIAGTWTKMTPSASPVTSVFGRTGAVIAVSGDRTWDTI